MQCSNCRWNNPEGANFCAQCGARLAHRCPECGSELSAEAAFCAVCGHDLSGGSSVTPPLRVFPSGGERRHATVLFSDLSGYMALSERLDPEVVQALMTRIKAEAVRIVEGHGGMVNQFVGDEVVALFGIPAAHEDDPVRAVRAARDLHDIVRAMSPEFEARIGAPLRLHTGISSGLIVTGNEDRRDGTYSITGATVNTGARLASHAKADTVLVSPATRNLIADYFQTEALEPVTLKGKADPVIPHRVIGYTAVVSRFEAAKQRGLTPFTGRREELETLQRCLVMAQEGQGQFVTVMGEAGLGKSRLAYEFCQGVDREQIDVLECHCQTYGTATPYLPFLDALRRGLELGAEKSAEELHDKAVRRILALDPALEEFLPHYLHLLSIPSERYRLPPGQQGDALRPALEGALAAFFTMSARRKPFLAIFEDWHWADEASESALKTLIGMVDRHAMLVVVLYRPEYPQQWENLDHYTPIVLKSMAVPHTESMLRAVLGADSLPEGLAERIYSRTDGNPFFNEEIGLALRGEGIVQVEAGTARLSKPLDSLELPGTVHAVIRARVDRLGSDAREVLRLASVIGREFDRSVLERIAPANGKLQVVLDVLSKQDLVHQVRVVPHAEYLFKHALTQVVIYETLLLKQRNELHERVGDAIEDLYADRLEEHYEALAHHYAHSDNLEKAVQYLWSAGDKAAKSFSLKESGGHYLSAIQRLSDGELTEPQMRSRIDLSLKFAAVWLYRASDDYFPILEASSVLALELEDHPRVIAVNYCIARRYFILGEITKALERSQRWMESAKSIGQDATLAPMTNLIGRLHVYTAEYAKAVQELGQGLEMLDRIGDRREWVSSMGFLALAHALLGDFDRALSLAEEGLEAARGIDNVAVACVSKLACGLVHLARGDWTIASEHLEEVIDHSTRIDNAMMAGLGKLYLGYVQAMLGNARQGLERMEEGIRHAVQEQNNLAMSQYLSMTAEVSASHGDLDVAVVHARQALELGHIGQRLGESAAYRSLAIAESQNRRPDWAKITEWMRISFESAEQRNELPNLLIDRIRYAEILHKRGELESAKAELDRAEPLIQQLGMNWWPEQAQSLRRRIESGEPFRGFIPYLQDGEN